MKNTLINPLVTALYSQQISKDEFIEQYFKNVPCDSEYVESLIKKGIDNKNAAIIEESIVLLNTDLFPLSFSQLNYVTCYYFPGI